MESGTGKIPDLKFNQINDTVKPGVIIDMIQDVSIKDSASKGYGLCELNMIFVLTILIWFLKNRRCLAMNWVFVLQKKKTVIMYICRHQIMRFV